MFAAIFPGQGSQKPGMGKGLFERGGKARETFEVIQQATGMDVAKFCVESDEEALRRTENAQIALYACGVAAWRELESRLGDHVPHVMAGHSVGEYAALACAGVLTIEDGARLVKRRGEIMAASGKDRSGTMAAVLGMEREALEEVCADASQANSVAVIANDNCPGQLVISGDAEAVSRASALAQERGAKRVLPLNVSGAFHSPLMEEAAEEMAVELDKVEFKQTHLPVVSNVTAEPITTPNLWPDLLERQLKSEVRWTDSVRRMIEMGITTFVECGSGEVLCGLIKRIDREVSGIAAYDNQTVETVIESLVTSRVGAV